MSSRQGARQRRHSRVRRKVVGSAERPRLAVSRSNKHITAQIIDDSAGRTLAAASTHEATLKGALNIESAAAVGKAVAEKAQAAGIKQVVFDRGGNLYHGRVAALGNAAREAGLEF